MWWQEVLLVTLVGGLLSLDERAVLQGMFSHPLVAGGLTGWLLGDPLLGFEMGLLIGLLWSYALPVGGVVPPSGTVVATAAVALAHWLGDTAAMRMFGVLWATPFGILAGGFEVRIRRWNMAMARRCELVSGRELGRALWEAQIVGLLGVLLAAGGTILLALVSGSLILPALGFTTPQPVLEGVGDVYLLLPFVGLGAAAVVLKVRRAFVFVAGVYLGLYGLVRWM